MKYKIINIQEYCYLKSYLSQKDIEFLMKLEYDLTIHNDNLYLTNESEGFHKILLNSDISTKGLIRLNSAMDIYPINVDNLQLKECSYCDIKYEEKDVKEYSINGYNRNLCRNCFDKEIIKCDTCSKNIMLDECNYDENECPICEECYVQISSRCCECNERCLTSGMHNANRLMYCDYCYEESVNNLLRKYSYKPDPIFYGDDYIYFGVELEVDADDDRNNCLKYLEKTLNSKQPICYFKKDGSLDEKNGIEIVTEPMSYDYWLSKAKIFEKLDVIDELDEYGMHIHVNRTAFIDKIHITKLLIFCKKYESFVEKIAERDYNQYCETFDSSKIKEKALMLELHPHRHDSINTTNKHTIEFRMFQSKKKSIIKNIEFIKSLIEFTLQSSLIDLTLSKYIEYVSKTNYKSLKKFIKTCV